MRWKEKHRVDQRLLPDGRIRWIGTFPLTGGFLLRPDKVYETETRWSVVVSPETDEIDALLELALAAGAKLWNEL